MANSIFTRIINGEIPCHRIAENAEFIAFLDVRPIARGHTLVVPKIEIDYIFDQSDAILDGMDSWNKSTHKKSGLIEKVKASTLTEAAVERQMIEFLREYVPASTSPMCGNSICQDRRFMANYMPKNKNLGASLAWHDGAPLCTCRTGHFLSGPGSSCAWQALRLRARR